MKVIFGLGNPGLRYKNNRHNVGFMVLDSLVKEKKRSFKRSFRLNAGIAEIDQLLLIKPRTYMNLSGECVKKIINKYNLSVEDILVVYDDVDLPLGDLRFRIKGSAGGHRGIASIISKIGSSEISRLKFGIGRSHNEETADHVLSDFKKNELEVVSETVSLTVSACLDWVKEGSDYVMKNYNRRGGL